MTRDHLQQSIKKRPQQCPSPPPGVVDELKKSPDGSGYRLGALSWMFRQTKLNWDGLLQASVIRVLRQYGTT